MLSVGYRVSWMQCARGYAGFPYTMDLSRRTYINIY